MSIFDGKTLEEITGNISKSPRKNHNDLGKLAEFGNSVLKVPQNGAEYFLQGYLTSNAMIRGDHFVEVSFWRAFHAGVRICEIDGYFWLCYNRDNVYYMQLFNQQHKDFVAFHLGRVKPKGKFIEFVKEEEIESAVAKYSELLNSEDMIAKYYDSRVIIVDPEAGNFPDDSELWLDLLQKAVEYNEELFSALRLCRIFKARLLSKKDSLVIDREYFDDESEEKYKSIIQPFLMQHLDWMKITLKSLNK